MKKLKEFEISLVKKHLFPNRKKLINRDNCSLEQAPLIMCEISDKNSIINLNTSKYDTFVQLDGNMSLLDDSSSNSSFSLPEDSPCNSLNESLAGITNLSEYLPFSSHDISHEDIAITSSFFSQPPSDQSYSQGSPATLQNRVSKVATKVSTALSLPNIMLANHRSVFPKFHSLIDELKEKEDHLGLHCEIWEDNEKVEHKNKVEEALELHGIVYISNPRTKKGGGGAAITLFDQKSQFTLSKLPIHVSPDLEVCWGLLKSRKHGSIKELIICFFYCPPRSKKKNKLVEHISINYFKLKSSFPTCSFICGGDKNDLNIKLLLDISPTFHQIVTKVTHKNSILDVIVTDIGHFYNEPIVCPPLLPDVPGNGIPSDHLVVHVTPISGACPPKRTSIIKTSRPFTTEAKLNIAGWILHESWGDVLNIDEVNSMVDSFIALVDKKNQ